MKKKFFKAIFAVTAIASVGLGSYKAYETYAAANKLKGNGLMSEAIEAEAWGEINVNSIYHRVYKDCSFTRNGVYYRAHYIDCLDGGYEECQPTACVLD